MRRLDLKNGEIVRDVPHGLERGLPNYWYPVLQTEEVPKEAPVDFQAMGHKLVAWRNKGGEPQIVADRCPHRNAMLSLGHILEGALQCPLHGLRFDGNGTCIRIPWEADDSPVLDRASITHYPARELGGYIWAYLGDSERFSPPPLEDEVPEELSDPDNFLIFRLPTEIWATNWLVAIDGGDAYHAVMLHADSQAVSTDKKWDGGETTKANVPMADRRTKIVETEHGIRGIAVDGAGEPIHHGHLTNQKMRGDRFILPCLTSNPIRPAPGAEIYTSRLWQFPVDDSLTRVERFLTFRARNTKERDRATKVFRDVALPRLQKIAAEDKMVAESQGNLINARQSEILFSHLPLQLILLWRAFQLG